MTFYLLSELNCDILQINIIYKFSQFFNDNDQIRSEPASTLSLVGIENEMELK